MKLHSSSLLLYKIGRGNHTKTKDPQNIHSGARNFMPLIVHITHFYYYKSI